MAHWTEQINKHTPVKIAKELRNVPNGECPPSLLVDVFNGKGTRIGKLPRQAARSWASMRAQALIDGVPAEEITATDTYRNLSTQKRLISERYTDSPLPGSPSNRVCDGKRIYLRPGMATAACAGHSNHGGQGAVDKGNGPKFHAWLETHALSYGWEWELPSEKWHLHYFAGDDIPKAVLDHEKIQTIKEDPEMGLAIIQCSPSRDEWPEIKTVVFKTNGLRSGTEWVPSKGHGDVLHEAMKVSENDLDNIVYVSPNMLLELIPDEFYAWATMLKPTKKTHPKLSSPYLPEG
jgi:LAS superfamily LD-carboxypeptidase LdcB